MMRTVFGLMVAMCLLLASGCGEADDRPRIAYVTNGVASFWLIAESGAQAAAEEFDVRVDVRMPTGGTAGQQTVIQDLLTRSYAGIAISPIDPENQGELINTAAAHCNVITHDADAPETDRLAYVGMDNYKAGRMCGELVKEAMPEGGSIMVFVGRLEQDNARGRRQGLIDELLDRPYDPENYDPPGDVIAGDKYTILDTQTDGFDFNVAKRQAEDAMARYPDLDCMVGLFAYNPPLMLEAVKQAEKLDQIKIIGFDEDEKTLQGIIDGEIYGTVVQDPYRYGYESVRILAGLARGDKSVLPEGGFLDIPARQVRQDNAQEVWDDIKAKTKRDE